MTRPIFFPATHKSERRAAASVHGRETRSSDLALIAFLSWRSQKKILSDLIRQKRAAPGPRATGIGSTARRAGRNHSSADLLLLISIKFNPARLAVGGAFTSCNSCLPLWSFSRGMPTLYQNARPWTLHYISRHETNKGTRINKRTRNNGPHGCNDGPRFLHSTLLHPPYSPYKY